jgi:hypothetical protein
VLDFALIGLFIRRLSLRLLNDMGDLGSAVSGLRPADENGHGDLINIGIFLSGRK